MFKYFMIAVILTIIPTMGLANDNKSKSTAQMSVTVQVVRGNSSDSVESQWTEMRCTEQDDGSTTICEFIAYRTGPCDPAPGNICVY